MEKYKVMVVEELELPPRVDWLFVRQDGTLQFWLKESVASNPDTLSTALEQAWAAFRDIDHDELLSWEPILSAAAS